MEKIKWDKSFKYDLDNIFDKIKYISNNFEIDWLISDWNSFQNFLQNFSEKNNFLPENIKAVEYKNNKVIIYLQDWKNYNFDFSDYKKEIAKSTLWDLDLEKLEEKREMLELAMESVFLDNTWITDELDEKDRFNLKKFEKQVSSWKIKIPNWKNISEILDLLKPFAGKNLLELRKEIDLSEENLKKYYEIVWDTKKSISILERQISHYAGIWDKYEGWARLFSMNSTELNEKTDEIVSKKTVSELIEYIRFLNNTIDDNWKIDDMAKAMNESVIKNISEKTFTKIKNTKAPNREVLNFVQVITWRKLTQEKNWKISESQLRVDVFNDFKQTEIANKALVYLLYDRWIIDKISKQQKVNLQTEVFKWKENNSVSSILDESMKKFEKLGLWEEQKEKIFSETWIWKIEKNKKISDLSFDETLLLGSIYSISNDIEKNISNLKNKKPEEIISFLQEKNMESAKKIFEDLNESLDKNFWATLLDWNWKSWKDFWLSWEEAEIFDLHGNVNWRWLFTLSDDNWFYKNIWNEQTWVVMAVWVATAFIVLSPAIMAAWWAWLLIAWAKIWLTTTIASQLMDKKWYSNVKEAAAWVALQWAIDIWSSALFTAGSGIIIWAIWPKISWSFWKTLTKEVASKNISTATQNRLWNILKEGNDTLISKLNIIRWPEKFWRPQLEKAINEVEVFKQAGFSWQLSENTIKYLWKYQAVNWWKWNIADIFIWLWDWLTSSLLWQWYWHWVVNKSFYENHYNPDAWETFESVRNNKKLTKEEIKLQASIIKNNMEKNISKNSDLKKEYAWLSEQEKDDLVIMFVFLFNNNKIWLDKA